MKFGDRVTLIMITGTVCTTLLLKDFKGCNCCPEKVVQHIPVPSEPDTAYIPKWDTLETTTYVERKPIERVPLTVRFFQEKVRECDTCWETINPDSLKGW